MGGGKEQKQRKKERKLNLTSCTLLSRIINCPPQVTDGQCLTTLKSNLDEYDKCYFKHIQLRIWLELLEQGYSSGSSANVNHFSTVQKTDEQRFCVNSMCPYLLLERSSS